MLLHPFPPKTKLSLLRKLRFNKFDFDLFPVKTPLDRQRIKRVISEETTPFEIIIIKEKTK